MRFHALFGAGILGGMMKHFKKYAFVQKILDAIDAAPSMNYFLKQLPGIIQQNLPLKQVILFYKNETGNMFSPYSCEIDPADITPLDEQSNTIRSFVKHKRSIFLEDRDDIYREIFDKDSNRLLERFDLNLVVPLYCRYYYKGLLVCRVDSRKRQIVEEAQQLVRAAAHIFIPIIETERLEVANDRNYYRLFKFDRLVLLGEMVASIAHELKTPMSTILLEIREINDMMGNNKEIDHSYNKIKKEIQRVNQFIRSLLSFSRFEETFIEEIDLDEFIRKSLKDIPRKRIPEKLNIKTSLESKQNVSFDRNRLRQVFLNIIFNAFDAAGPGGEITIKTYSEHEETVKDTRHYIAIHDNGPGIPGDIKEKILEPFFTTKKDGIGLGLYISYGIMQTLKGDLEIESSNNNGTTVYIVMPGD